MSKYRAIPTTVDGIRFASKKEARRYSELLMLQRANVICELELQPEFEIAVKGQRIAKYIADFAYKNKRTGVAVIEDVKGMKTPVYRLKKKLVEAIHGVEITEV